MIARLQQPVAERAQLVGHRAQAREARGQQLADRPLLGVLEHVLDHLDRRDGERQVVALAVAARLEQRLVGELRRVERRDVAQVRLKGDGGKWGQMWEMWEGMWEGGGRDVGRDPKRACSATKASLILRPVLTSARFSTSAPLKSRQKVARRVCNSDAFDASSGGTAGPSAWIACGRGRRGTRRVREA